MNLKPIFIAAALFLSIAALEAAKPIQALLITGQNNHNWPVSSVVIKKQLEDSGKFEVTVATSPKQGEDMSKFILDFSPYKLVILDYNGDHWPEATRTGFMDFVNKGGGVVVYHAADNAFGDWPEFTKIVALGGWGEYNEQSGPYAYWKDGALFKDNSPGRAGSHGKQHVYTLTRRNDKHPITKGLPETYQHGPDELYDRMRGPANIKDVLYTAFSSLDTNGSGREEILIFTVDHPKARIFHTMIGHAGPTVENCPAMNTEAFKVTLLRGCEWAATGKVSK